MFRVVSCFQVSAFLCALMGAVLQGKGETTLFREDFSGFKSDSDLLRVVDSQHPEFARALELRSVKAEDGKIRQGHWELRLGNVESISESETMEIRFWMKAATESARYALLANGKGHKAITLIQNNGFFEIPKSAGASWEKIARNRLNGWHKMLYRVHCQQGAYDVFVDDMETPVAQMISFREPASLFIDRIWTLGSENAESRTLFGPVTVSLTFPKEFPPESFNGNPFCLKGIGETTNGPAPTAFDQQAPLVLGVATGSVKEAASLRLLRDQTNLYCLFRLDVRGAANRPPKAVKRDGRIWDDDCVELFFQPDPRRDTYYHLAANAAGSVYDSRHQTGSRDDAWNGHWSCQIRQEERGWTALVTVPFADFGGDLSEDAVWGFNAGRENPYTREVLSWTIPERFGRICFPALNDPRPAPQRIAALMDRFCDFPDRFQTLSREVQEELSFPHPVLQETRRELGEKLKSLAQAHGRAASFQEFVQLDAALKRLHDAKELLRRKATRMSDLFMPGSDNRRRAYAACVESSMAKVMEDYCGNPETRASLLLSGNEYGSFQIVLLAMPGDGFRRVKISIAPLQDRSGKVLANARQRAYLVESVRTAMPHQKAVGYPDVLKPGADFRVGNRLLVPLWLDVFLPPGTAAGTYQSQIEVRPDDSEPCVIPVAVRATGLTLPLSASLDTAFCFDASWVKAFYGQDVPPEKVRDYCEFILDHRLEPMNLWSGGNVDIGLDHLDYCAQHGKTLLFLPITNLAKNKAKYQTLISRYQGKLRPVFFGHDEVLMQNSAEKLAAMKKDFALAKELFPDVPRLNTAPVDARLFGYVDIWCPLFSHFNAADASERMKLGEKVWWYPTDYPLAPYANFNLDSPGIDPRIIPWMNWKLNLSGLLYWGLNREWLTNGQKEIKQITSDFIGQRSLDWMTPELQRKMIAGECRWPEVPWLPYFRSVMNAKSVSATNGGGNLLYPGPVWEPWPSMRLKNLRDGMQDYEYFVMLKKNVAALESKNPNHPLLPKARKVLAIDDDVLGGETRYTKDPERLLAFRQELIRLVMETGKLL